MVRNPDDSLTHITLFTGLNRKVGCVSAMAIKNLLRKNSDDEKLFFMFSASEPE